MDLLQPVIRPYAWGSRTAIAELQGRPAPAPGPEAELWMGAHPASPAVVTRAGVTAGLDRFIAADPRAALGPEADQRFGGRLPFLLKVLAVDKALSIQVHPSAEQARAGYAAENAQGVLAGAPGRNYVDDWPKPEILVALTPFQALAGMRSAAEAAAFLTALEVPALAPVRDRLAAAGGLAAGGAESGSLSEALGAILAIPAGDRPGLLASVTAGYRRLAAGTGEFAPAARALLRVATSDHPGDIGAVAAALLRYVELLPGEAIFLPAGGLHAYLRGTGLELLANSDNVLRAGLTGKHIDVPELLRLLAPAVTVPVLRAEPAGEPWLVRYPAPAPEFGLVRAELAGEEWRELPGTGPRIAWCAEGQARLRSASGSVVKLNRAESCFIPASDGALTGTGPGVLFLAEPGRDGG